MTPAFLQLPASERKVYIDEAAARRGLAPVILEKDFWVCWLLSILFQLSFRDAIVFHPYTIDRGRMTAFFGGRLDEVLNVLASYQGNDPYAMRAREAAKLQAEPDRGVTVT